MAILKKFYGTDGDLSICVKWYKDLVLPLINGISPVDGFKKTFTKEDKNSQGKKVQIIISIRYSIPDYHVLIIAQPYSTGGNLSSGLSINELNDTTFKQFYPRDGQGFQDYSRLFRSKDVLSDLPFFQKYQGKSVNQSHYINGRQFSGSLGEQVQNMLGTTSIDIVYQNLWTHSNGLYKDSQNNYWLITVKNNTSNDITRPNSGVYARKITTTKYTDGVIKTVNNSTSNVSYDLADGFGYIEGDTLLLSLSQFYNGFALSYNQGWSFNKKGNKLQNISYSGNITANRYEITINEINNNGNISLQASYSIVETGSINLHNLFSVMSPLYNDYNTYSMEQVHNFNYSQVKYNPLARIDLDSTETSSLTDNEYKLPIQCYFDEQDKIKVIYYYFKKEPYATATESTSGFTTLEDFNNGSYTRMGDFKTGTKLEEINSNYLYNYNINHGVVVNDNTDLLINNNGGAYTNYYKKSLMTGDRQTDFAYQVENDLIGINLKQYRTFEISIDSYNQQVELFQNNYNAFKDFYVNTKFSNKSNLLISDDYVLDKQFKEINDALSFDSRFTKINEVHSLLEISKLEKLNFKNIYLPYLLYELNDSVLDIFTTVNDTYKNNISSKLDTINTLIETYFGGIYVNYYNSIRTNYKKLFNYFRSIQDKSTLNISYVNSLIKDLNDNHVSVINDMIDSINSTIETINNHINDINDYVTKVEFYNNLVEQFNSNIKGYNGIYIDSFPLAEVKLSATNKDVYFLGKKVYFYKNINETYYANRDITKLSFIFNNANRNSISVFNQNDSFEKIVDINSSIQDIIQSTSNEYCLYKQNNNNGVLGDFEKIEVFYNRKQFNYTDYIGNVITFNGGTNITAIDNGFSLTSDNLGTGTFYNGIYLLEDYDNIPKNTVKFNLSNMSSTYNLDYIEEPITTSKIQTIDKQVINQDSTIKNDYRLINTDDLFGENKVNKYKYDRNYYNQLYFNMFRDNNSFNYVISKDLSNSYDSKLVLTNISKYTIININYVNFIGLAFNKE